MYKRQFEGGKKPEAAKDLKKHLRTCQELNAQVMRIVVSSLAFRHEPHGPQIEKVSKILRDVMPRFEDNGVKIGKMCIRDRLLGAKWILENIKSDYHQIVFYPDFMWVEDVEPFGAEIVYPEDDSPWVSRPHFLQKNDNLDQLRSVDYINNGLHGKMISYYQEMKKQAQDYEIHFSDGKIIPAVDCVMMGRCV